MITVIRLYGDSTTTFSTKDTIYNTSGTATVHTNLHEKICLRNGRKCTCDPYTRYFQSYSSFLVMATANFDTTNSPRESFSIVYHGVPMNLTPPRTLKSGCLNFTVLVWLYVDVAVFKGNFTNTGGCCTFLSHFVFSRLRLTSTATPAQRRGLHL